MTFNYIYNSIQLLFGRRDETLYYCHYFIETFFADAVYLTDATSGLDKEKAAATRVVLAGLAPLHVKLMSTDEYLAER